MRQVLLPGWGVGDTHAQQSNLARGFDNWLYGTVGYSDPLAAVSIGTAPETLGRVTEAGFGPDPICTPRF